jgi:hypothetical protein
MSQLRACIKFKATDGKWYLQLGNFEHAYSENDCTMYGPFERESQIDPFIHANFSNPGCSEICDLGIDPPPKNPVDPSHRNMRKFY